MDEVCRLIIKKRQTSAAYFIDDIDSMKWFSFISTAAFSYGRRLYFILTFSIPTQVVGLRNNVQIIPITLQKSAHTSSGMENENDL
jgi:hypothetical protein